MSELLLTAIRQSSPEEKRLAFAELAKELFRANRDGPIAIQDGQSRTVCYEIDASEQPFPKLSDAEDAELRRRAETRGPTLTTEDFIGELDRGVLAASLHAGGVADCSQG